jgi:VPDSG-CTERM motif
MPLFNNSLLGAVLAMALNFDANALSITPATQSIMTFSSSSQSVITSQINAFFDPDPTLAYKMNVGGPEEGPFAASYSTSFFNTPSDPADATISYISGQMITAEDIYLLVKDGNQSPTGYLFDISAWNGAENLVLTGFWPAQGAISHVSIYTNGNARVPDGGATLMLLGIGLSGLAAARRWFVS